MHRDSPRALRGPTDFTWSALGQLEAVDRGSTSVEYEYDAFGRRVRATVNEAATWFVHDGAAVVAGVAGGQTSRTYHHPGGRNGSCGLGYGGRRAPGPLASCAPGTGVLWAEPLTPWTDGPHG